MTEEELKRLQDKKAEEIAMTGGVIRPEATYCKKCLHALPDTEYTKGALKATCEMYLDSKPNDVLMNGAECDFFEEKEE